MAEITKETFTQMDVPSKLDVLFDYVHEIQVKAPVRCKSRMEMCESRFEKMEGRQKIWGLVNSTLVSTFSFVGGFTAVWTAIKFKIFGGQ
jgi:hypothetical protein